MHKGWLGLVIGCTALCAYATTFLTQQEALEKAFPGAVITRRVVTLTPEQMDAAAARAGQPIPSALVYAYEATREGRVIGTAYFDAHRVHSLPQTLMIVVAPDGRVQRVEVLAFQEPLKYQAPAAWLDQFKGRGLDDGWKLRTDIQGITGATLTSRATTRAVRRALAIHAVISGEATGVGN